MFPTSFARAALAASLALALPFAAQAHRSFLVPSSTVLAPGQNQWVTVDAARGNDLFFFNHNAMPVDGLVITAPDGATVRAAKLERFRYRTVFDWQVDRPGTWRAAVVDDGLRAQWEQDGKPQRWSGAPADFAKAVPAGAAKLSVNAVSARVETFVTMGKPSPLSISGKGLEASYAPHPNDLVVGSTSTVTFTLDGRPAAGLKVVVVPGGARYRDATQQQELLTDEAGRVQVAWRTPGLYWINASQRQPSAVPPAKQRVSSYAATLEVLPE